MTTKTERNLILIALVVVCAWTWYSYKKGHLTKY